MAVAYARGTDPEPIAPVETWKFEPQELLDQSLCVHGLKQCDHQLSEACMLLIGQAAETAAPRMSMQWVVLFSSHNYNSWSHFPCPHPGTADRIGSRTSP